MLGVGEGMRSVSAQNCVLLHLLFSSIYCAVNLSLSSIREDVACASDQEIAKCIKKGLWLFRLPCFMVSPVISVRVGVAELQSYVLVVLKHILTTVFA